MRTTCNTPSFLLEDRVEQLDIACQSGNSANTRCAIAYTMTALTDVARQIVESYTEEKHKQRIAHWQVAINHYLQTGTRLEHHE